MKKDTLTFEWSDFASLNWQAFEEVLSNYIYNTLIHFSQSKPDYQIHGIAMIYYGEYMNLEVSLTSLEHLKEKDLPPESTGDWEFYNYTYNHIDKSLEQNQWTENWNKIRDGVWDEVIEKFPENEYENCMERFRSVLEAFEKKIREQMDFLNLTEDWVYIVEDY